MPPNALIELLEQALISLSEEAIPKPAVLHPGIRTERYLSQVRYHELAAGLATKLSILPCPLCNGKQH